MFWNNSIPVWSTSRANDIISRLHFSFCSELLLILAYKSRVNIVAKLRWSKNLFTSYTPCARLRVSMYRTIKYCLPIQICVIIIHLVSCTNVHKGDFYAKFVVYISYVKNLIKSYFAFHIVPLFSVYFLELTNKILDKRLVITN